MRTAEKLRITQPELDGLVTVYELLMSGDIVHHSVANGERIGNLLNMEISGGSDERGTVACLGGYVSAFSHGVHRWSTGTIKLDRYEAQNYMQGGFSSALSVLYHPLQTRFGAKIVRFDGEPYDYPWDLIEPREAAAAVYNFLHFGKPDWTDVLFDYLPRPAVEPIDFPSEPLLSLIEEDTFRVAA